MYKIKYLKYKNKYLQLKKQLGGECDPLPDLGEEEYITREEYNTRGPNNRITINGRCYFVNELFDWIIRYNHNKDPLRSIVSTDDKLRLIDAYNILYPATPHTTGIPAYVEKLIHDGDWSTSPIQLLRSYTTINDNDESILQIYTNVSEINDNEFENRNIDNVIIPNTVTHIGNNAFNNNNIKTLKIPRSVIHIGDNAFANNQFLRVVIMPHRFSNTQSKQRIFGYLSRETNFIYQN